mgnify:CR=1 FL=1
MFTHRVRRRRDPASIGARSRRTGERDGVPPLLRETGRGMNQPARKAVDALLACFHCMSGRAAPALVRLRRRPRALPAGPARRALPRPVGVGARTSATKSQIVKSVSWPTPDTTGITDSNTARATISSLKDHRSSIEPPRARRSGHRHRRRRRPRRWPTRCRRQRRRPGRPWGRGSTARRASDAGAWSGCRATRRRATDVTMPIARGKAGSGRFRSAAEPAGRGQARLQALEFS